MPGNTKINFQKAPFKGVFSFVAKQLGRDPRQVRRAFYYDGNPEVRRRVNDRVDQIIAEERRTMNQAKLVEREGIGETICM